MAHHISRNITPIFTENTDISLESNRHMMLHELQKLMQEMRTIKLDVHNNEEKSKRIKIENDTHIQKLLDEIKEMKLYINEQETEKQRTNTENNEMRTQVTALREKQEKEINELRMIEENYETLKVENNTHLQKLLEEMKEMKLHIHELETEKQRTNTENNELRIQVTALWDKQEKEINELRSITDLNLRMIELQYKMLKVENNTHVQKLLEEIKEMKLYIHELETEKQRTNAVTEKQNQEINELSTKISGQETEISELKTKCCQMQTEFAIVKENVPFIINGLYEQMLKDSKSRYWDESRDLMKRHLSHSTQAYKQMKNIIDCVDTQYDYPLEVAEGGFKELIQVMLDNGLPINRGYDNNITMLHGAAEHGQYILVKFLIQRGADVNVKCRENNTPLHLAAWLGNVNIVKVLVEGGADINVTDIHGETPLQRAARRGHESVVQYLVDIGCDTTITNNRCQTAADVASTQEIREIIL